MQKLRVVSVRAEPTERVAYEDLVTLLSPYGQSHLLAFWDELDVAEQQKFCREILQIDWKQISQLYSEAKADKNSAPPQSSALAEQADQPASFLSSSDPADDAIQLGEHELRAGRVGMVLVAGGQGTRLGFPHPKGMYSLGPVSQRSLFQILIDKLRAAGKRYGVEIPLYIMTSPATHDETVEFLKKHEWFGMAAESVHLFCQGVMPSIDATTGKALLASHGSLALSPDGHGGMLSALQSSGLLEEMSDRGLRHLFYGQIDNPLLPVCDPRLLGAHALAQSEMSTLAVRKRSPLEKVGNLVSIAGRSHIIEYSDIPESIVEQRRDDGSLRLWAGNIAIHVFDVAFLQRVADDSHGLPFHRALKKVPCLDAMGNHCHPEQPNAMKFERFIFDLLPLANRTIAVEGDRDQCFAPVKNPIGSENDTPETSRRAMVELDRRLLKQCGVVIGENADVEINPLWAIDAQELCTKVAPGTRVDGPTWFSEEELHTGQQAARKAA